MSEPKYYEQWTMPELLVFANLSEHGINKILNNSGFLSEFTLENLLFKKFIVVDQHLQAIYTADIPGDKGDDWNNCDIFIWRKENGTLTAEFAGTPNHPVEI